MPTNPQKTLALWLVLVVVCALPKLSLAAQFKGLVQLRYTDSENPDSWLYRGSGLYRYSEQHNGLTLGSSVLSLRQELGSAFSAHAVVQAHRDENIELGFTEAYVRYKPLLPSGYEWQLQVGGFYPALSLENPDIGWTSPYLYTNSAINSWVGEELRTFGAELTLGRPGRRFNSPHSLELVGAVYKANDPAGSLLAWRGFAIHDRQSLFNERIPFADNPAFDTPQLRWQANDVLPFSEVDGRFGYYLGGHWDYYKRSQLRLYYYDNNGDPASLNEQSGQYAWDTRFWSLSWLFKLTDNTRLITQAIQGSTAMGDTRGVNNDYRAWFLLLSHSLGAHRISARYDDFEVIDNDHWAFDPNNSHGESLAVAWRYRLDKHWQVGAEVSRVDSYVENRQLWWEAENASQTQWQVNFQYRF
ncbi:hypothetical protein [Gilvimarinus algae]|uniref:Porin n=1 Tax=Gilvimarinus algae TaxID=3058037 RepID=A0ABT8TKL6_9GAMM|nr:hypothetical protein [Gilvimarinus sp. SDUM040014]MDO3383653.1 hypothetical protein [Gilvimarinus sp. SDUM040014]